GCGDRSRPCVSSLWPCCRPAVVTKRRLAVRRGRLPPARRTGLLPVRVSGKGIRDCRGGCRLVQGVRHHLRQRQVQRLLRRPPGTGWLCGRRLEDGDVEALDLPILCEALEVAPGLIEQVERLSFEPLRR